MNNTLPPQANQQGILLLEVMISVLIFSFALLGLIALQARATQFSVDAEDRSRASLLANEIVTSMWLKQSIDTSNLGPEISAWESRLKKPSQGGLPNASGVVRTQNGVATITITWSTHNGINPQTSATTTRTYSTQIAISPSGTGSGPGSSGASGNQQAQP